MRKKYITALISTLLLSINPVFADINTPGSEAQVEAIITQIEQAKTKPEAIEETKQAETKIVKAVEEPKQVEVKAVQAVEELKQVEEKIVKAVEEPKQVEAKAVTKVEKKNESTDIKITMPTVPEVPKAIKLSPSLILVDEKGNIVTKNLEELYPKRKKIIFSTNVAPERFRKKKNNDKDKIILPGDIELGRVPAYIQSKLLSVDEVVSKLQSANYEILSTFKVDKKGTVTSIVFTNEAIRKSASKTMRGFAGTLRIVVDTKNKLVNISNPIYIMKAFMQKEYDAVLAENTLTHIRGLFGELKNSPEVVKFLALERYQFMENMPFYQDMKVVAKAKNQELLKRAKKSKKVVYTQELTNGSFVVGVKLGKRTSKFVKKIGYQNSGLLPYPVLIENGEAKIMAPQYYIAVMYPMLKMSKFMTIATVPGAITKDVDKIFR